MPIKRVIKYIPAKGTDKFFPFHIWLTTLQEPEKSQAIMINNAKQLLIDNKTETGDMITTKHTDHVEYYYSNSSIPSEITGKVWYNLYEKFLLETGQSLEIIDEEI
jgi:hypothetical protein